MTGAHPGSGAVPRRWDISVLVEDPAWRQAVPGAAATASRALRCALAGVGAPAGGMSLLLSDDRRVQHLNAAFRGFDRPTNVLSFPADGGADYFGDIILARQTLQREAAVQDKRVRDHLAHLVVHAVLHLFGYDHRTGGEAERMEWRERRILADLSIADPYRPRSGRRRVRTVLS